MDQEDKLVWNRVVERRRRECASLDKIVALQFLASLPVEAPQGSPSDQLEFALKNAYDIASDPNAKVKERRAAFESIQELRKSLNESLEQYKKLSLARFNSATATALTNAKAMTTTTTTTAAAITTANNSQDRTRMPLVPHITAPTSVPPVSPARGRGNRSEPSRPTVSQNAAVSVSPPLPTTTAPVGTTALGQVAEKTKKTPILFAAGARGIVNGIGKGTSTSGSDAGSHRTTHTSKSNTNRDFTAQATPATHRQQIAATTPTTTSPLRSPQTARPTVAGAQKSTTSTGNASSKVSNGTQSATATGTRPLSTQTLTNATSNIDRSAPTGNVPQPSTGAGTASSKSSTQTQTITATGNIGRTTPTIPQTTTGPASRSLQTQSTGLGNGTGIADSGRKAPGLFQLSPATRRPSLTNQAATAGTSAAPGTGTGMGGRFVPAAPQTTTRAVSWGQTHQTATAGTGTWGVPTQTGTSGTGNAGRSASTANQAALGAGRWAEPTKTSTTGNGAATWGVPPSTAINGIDTNTKNTSLFANRSSGHAGVSQSNAPALANKNRSSITADLVAAATTTAQVAADSLSDAPPAPAPASKTKPTQQQQQTTTVVAPPAYQQRSDAVVAIEKANRTGKSGHSSQSTAQTSNTQPTILSPFQPPMSSKKRPREEATNNESMDTTTRSDTRVDNDRIQITTDNSSAKEPQQKIPRVQDPPAAVMEATTQVAKTQIVIDFPPDTKAIGENRYSYSQADRPAVRVFFHRHWPTYEMLRGAGRLFEMWEPYWQVEKVVASGVTSPVEKVEWKAKPTTKKDGSNIPKTVAFFDVPTLSATDISKISWGALKAQSTSKPKDGDCTLLLRMLPMKRKPEENKKRANTHLWPIGTFIMINNTPTVIAQRKQASHDLSKWEYLSHPLELSYHIKNPKQEISISMCCQDSTQFFYMVSICSYKSPLTLKDRLLEPNNPSLHSLSMSESAKKAMDYINKNSMISVDDDENGGQNEETGILIFSLVDPVTKVLMKTPVRGQKCKHWQCFDLQSFMEVNAPVSGGRWRCVCCEQFVNYQDLEVCGLTKEALVRFAEVASATRDRVEFRADQTMTLLPPPKLRHNNKRRPQSASSTSSSKQPVKNQQASIPEPIEIIDLD